MGFETHDWIGYNEGMLSMPWRRDRRIPGRPRCLDQGWAGKLDGPGAPITGRSTCSSNRRWDNEYSHVWIDSAGRRPYIRSKGIDYFENSRRAILSQKGYGTANPNNWVGYDGNVWGWSASDGPIDATYTVNGTARLFHTYVARGVSSHRVEDDGTIVPMAAGGSVPFAPEPSPRCGP